MTGQRVVHENFVHVWFVAGGIADDTLATVLSTELDAAVGPLEITVDGLNTSATNNNASIAMMTSGKIGNRPGTRQKDVTLKFARLDDTGSGDEAWTTFGYNTAGDLVVHRFGPTPTDGASLEVYRGASHEPSPIASAQDTYQQFEVPFAVDDWEIKATLSEAS